MALERHVVKVWKIALERQNGAQSRAYGLKKHGRNIKKFLAKNEHLSIPGFNFKSNSNHTIWGSFESSLALENGENNEMKWRLTSSEARGYEREYSQPITSSEARG